MIKGFSKLSKEDKIKILQEKGVLNSDTTVLNDFQIPDSELRELIEGFSENTLTSYPFPYGLAPNFYINQKEYSVPMVTEESSVVAAAAKSARYWAERGGFHVKVINTVKTGQVHFHYFGNASELTKIFPNIRKELFLYTSEITRKMNERGGGIQDIELVDKTSDIPNYFQLNISFETQNAMGANFMNSCLESIASGLVNYFEKHKLANKLELIMSILSNYSPECKVHAYVECPINELTGIGNSKPYEFARKFASAVQIADLDVNRAVTHNKGIYNGIDAVALATGNDWRALEANGHAYAAKTGRYRSLSYTQIDNGVFHFGIIIPLQVGTIGGVTSLHPLAKLSLEILQCPSATDLMGIMASVGLASNFAAVSSLITTGIQKGHMKMHLNNILKRFEATPEQINKAKEYFKDKTISVASAEKFLSEIQ